MSTLMTKPVEPNREEFEAKYAAALLTFYRDDIALFAKGLFDVDLTEEQAAFCEEFRTNRQIDRTEATAWGKTFCTAILTWWSLICFDDVLVTIVNPSEIILKLGVWQEIQKLHARMAAPFKDTFEVSATKAFRKINPNGCYAHYRLASSPESVRGLHSVNTFVFVDEANGVSEKVIQNLNGIFSDPNPKLCILHTKLPEAAKPAPVTEAELFNEAMSAFREIVRGEGHTDPVRYEAIRYQLTNAFHLSERAAKVQ